MTFEHELGKVADSTYFPDYYGTEIKCTSRFSHYPIHLFSIAFDGPTYPEINRIIEKYDWYDKIYKTKKVLYANIYYNRKTLINNKFYFKLNIDDINDKLYLEVYDLNNNLIEKESFIYIQSIYNHFVLKLQKLAIVKASIKRQNNEEYYRYYDINIYELINFDNFIKLLKNEEINVELIGRISKSGKNAGYYRNKNMVFNLNKNNIEKIFKKIYSYKNNGFITKN